MRSTANSRPAPAILLTGRVAVFLINDDVQIATLSLSTAYVAILLRANTMRINGRLGSLALNDDSAIRTASPDFKRILSIEGDNFADFTYQTYDPADHETYTGVKSSISLQTGSLKVHYLEHTLHDAYFFMMKLAKLKGLYDAATVAAVQRASEIERMKFDVSISTPIIVFPSDAQNSLDVITLRLGSLKAHNSYDANNNCTTAGLHGIQLASRLYYDSEPAELKIVDDIDINAEVIQKGDIDRSKDADIPATQVLFHRPAFVVLLITFIRCPLRSRMSASTSHRHNIVSSSRFYSLFLKSSLMSPRPTSRLRDFTRPLLLSQRTRRKGRLPRWPRLWTFGRNFQAILLAASPGRGPLWILWSPSGRSNSTFTMRAHQPKPTSRSTGSQGSL